VDRQQREKLRGFRSWTTVPENVVKSNCVVVSPPLLYELFRFPGTGTNTQSGQEAPTDSEARMKGNKR